MQHRFVSVAAALLLSAVSLAGTTGTALMATLNPLTVVTPLETFPAGTSTAPTPAQNGGWLDISGREAQGYNFGQIGVDTTHFPVTDTVAVTLQFTGDNGVTIEQGCGFTTIGGAHTDRQGRTVFPACSANLPAEGPSGLKVRAQVTIPEAGQLRLGAQLEQST